MSNLVRERLDRGVANMSWMEMFPNYAINHLTCSVSDHCPLIMDTEGTKIRLNRFSERELFFEAMWFKEAECMSIVEESWKQEESNEIYNKLDGTKRKLLKWSQGKFRGMHNKIEQLTKELHSLKLRNPDDWIKKKRRMK